MILKIYGTKNCIDCVETVKVLDEMKEEYEFIELNDHIKNLKKFLRLRDNMVEFNEIRKEGYIGVPCFYFEDHTVFFTLEDALSKKRSMESVEQSI